MQNRRQGGFIAGWVGFFILAGLVPGFGGSPIATDATTCEPFIWRSMPIVWNPDLGNLGDPTGPGYDNAGAVAATAAAFDLWAGSSPETAFANLSFRAGPPLPVDVNETNFGPFVSGVSDGLNPIIYDANGAIFAALGLPGILGVAGFDRGTFRPNVPGTATIVEGYAIFNGAFLDGVPPDSTKVKFASTFTHELGHFIGLGHSQVNGRAFLEREDIGFGVPPVDSVETMFPIVLGDADPEMDDRVMASALYPGITPAVLPGMITGTIFSTDGTTKLSGVNVIARNIADPFFNAVSRISGDDGGGDPVSACHGKFTMKGLDGSYRVEVDEITSGSFSTPPFSPLPGPEEFFNGTDEATTNPPDNPTAFTPVRATLGMSPSRVDIAFNGAPPPPSPPPSPPPPPPPPLVEVCDGVDNDLDGMTDEGFVDTDRDGIADCVDPDDDGDGLADTADECPLLPTSNTIIGTAGRDRLNGTPGNDLIRGLSGDDIIKGRGGNDCLVGGAGKDKVYGDDGNDIVYGGDGNDQLFGGRGNDVLNGGLNVDKCSGNAGIDTAIQCEKISGVP